MPAAVLELAPSTMLRMVPLPRRRRRGRTRAGAASQSSGGEKTGHARPSSALRTATKRAARSVCSAAALSGV